MQASGSEGRMENDENAPRFHPLGRLRNETAEKLKRKSF